MVNILEAQFPKGKCRERGRALVMLSYLEMMHQGVKIGEDGFPLVKCKKCYDKGFSSELRGGTQGYPDWGSMKKIRFSGMHEVKNYCSCAKGKRMKSNDKKSIV